MEQLKKMLHPMVAQGLCVAFSGGVDSSVLLRLACEVAQGKEVFAVTFSTKLHPCADLDIARQVAQEVGATHVVLEVNELDCPAILQNPVDRCYQCKGYLFAQLLTFAKAHHCPHVIDGTNADDLHVYRPGIRALQELGIASPLATLGITKAQVRTIAQDLGLSVSHRPSAPCLATRLPYNTPIDLALLSRIDQGETYLKSLGFAINRIRVHGDIARIEIPTSQFSDFFIHQTAIVATLKALQFPYITLDVEGFRSGSMDIHVGGSPWT